MPSTRQAAPHSDGSVFQDEGDEHVHLIFDDLSLVEPYLLLLDPGASNVSNRLARPREALLNRVLEADLRKRADLRILATAMASSWVIVGERALAVDFTGRVAPDYYV